MENETQAPTNRQTGNKRMTLENTHAFERERDDISANQKKSTSPCSPESNGTTSGAGNLRQCQTNTESAARPRRASRWARRGSGPGCGKTTIRASLYKQNPSRLSPPRILGAVGQAIHSSCFHQSYRLQYFSQTKIGLESYERSCSDLTIPKLRLLSMAGIQ